MAKELKTELKNVHSSREAWLKAGTDALRPYFELCDDGGKYKLPDNIRFSIAFTSHGRKGKTTGECLFPDVSADSHFEIIIRNDRDDAMDVMGVLIHQLTHVVAGRGHGTEFKEAAAAVGLDIRDGLRAAMPGKRLKEERLNDIVLQLGPLPHGRVDFAVLALRGKEVSADRPKKQAARMLKAECRQPGCGFLVRLSSKWIKEVGKPHCPKHGEMYAADDEPAPAPVQQAAE